MPLTTYLVIELIAIIIGLSTLISILKNFTNENN